MTGRWDTVKSWIVLYAAFDGTDAGMHTFYCFQHKSDLIRNQSMNITLCHTTRTNPKAPMYFLELSYHLDQLLF